MTDSFTPNHDEPAEGPRDSGYSTSSGAETGTGETNGAGDAASNASAKANDVFDQIRVAVDDFAVKAGPTVREFSAKAAELVAVAADKAAPIAHKAGEATAEASTKLAERSRGWAAEVREHADEDAFRFSRARRRHLKGISGGVEMYRCRRRDGDGREN